MGIVIKTKKIYVLILIVIISVLTMSCNDREDEALVQEVDLSDELTEIEAFGIVKAAESKDVIIDFPAKVIELIAIEGQHLELNDPILTLDLSDYYNLIRDKNNELNIAKLDYQRANASLKGLKIQDIDIEMEKLNSELELAKKVYDKALEDHSSNQALYNMGAISKEMLQKSKLALDEAHNNVATIEYQQQLTTEKYNLELDQLNTKQSAERYQVSIQNERIKQIENSLNSLADKINKPYIIDNQIVSEFENAAVYDIIYNPGSIVDTTSKAFTIVNLDSLIIEADVVEEFIRDIQIGSSVRIVPVADRSREYIGKVIYISQIAFTNNNETEVPIRISIDNIDSFLLPNYNVDVFIDVK